MKRRVEDLSDRLMAHGICYPSATGSEALSGELARYMELRDASDRGEDHGLPSTDFGGKDLTVDEAAVAALITDFALRRAIDGLDPSRPVAVDALRLATRLSLALEEFTAGANAAHIPKKLAQSAYLLATAVFEVSRSVVGYLGTHAAPDVLAGRDEPDAWLDVTGTAAVRRSMLELVVKSQRTVTTLLLLHPDSMRRHAAAQFLWQRVIAHAQVASAEFSGETLADRIRDTDWLTREEVEYSTAEEYGDPNHALAKDEAPHRAIALSVISLVESGAGSLEDTLAALIARGELAGRNLVSALRMLISLIDDPKSLEALAERILDATADLNTPDAIRQRTESIPQLLSVLSAVARDRPDAALQLARRIAGLSNDVQLDGPHMWVVPSRPSIAIVETAGAAAAVIDLPGLDDPELMSRMVLDHAEEFERHVDLGPLRRDLGAAIEPLRDVLVGFAGPVSVHAFGVLKHIPFAALTGRGSILAVEPVVKILAFGSPALAERPEPKRLIMLDDDLAQSSRIKLKGSLQVERFTSRAEQSSPAAIDAFAALGDGSAGEILFFGHGHVDQFRVDHTGLVVQQRDEGNLVIPSLQIARFDLRRTKLAVIMACGGGQSNVFVEPSMSVGHAFRHAGVQIVIAPQWPIYAESAAEFVNRFFRRVDDGEPYVAAWSAVLAEDPNRFMSIALFGA